MTYEHTLKSSGILDVPAQSSSDLEVLRHQLLHVRQKYEDLLLSKRRRIARALCRVRSNSQRRLTELQSRLLGYILEQTVESLDSHLEKLTENYVNKLQKGIRETLLKLYEEEEPQLIQKVVERLYSLVAEMSPRSSYRIILNSVDFDRIAKEALPKIPLEHRHEVKRGTAILISPMGEVLFDWLTPLQNTLRLSGELRG